MPRRFKRAHRHAPEIDRRPVRKRCERVFGLGSRAETDTRTDSIAQLQMPSQEVGVQVGENDVFDAQSHLRGSVEILLDVALRIDDCGPAALRVANQIRRMGKTIQIELLQDHRHIIAIREFSRRSSKAKNMRRCRI